ncbi:phenylalanine--tRNA ligase subunit beta [Leptospira borgpetersenii]|uniref:phenylalanine--tRNA ligase subunit beta n=1 Tax=Leptospira borgpetersenii TaxID=174 RepID=UPI000773E742|nr:phenylalanine--tRNA ligase subunit beta [Leptospira borgpetersenii]MBE8401614.1 phenylalanine--tRNA ligase subunit beta [Leptospira borgpetersenii serovar Tarassovi]MBE8404594.1 phenylalanine--tRNA ligase subunit beta [Leptospira borgpetersenii serovar Tarassovi]MBE8407754.1 phenylalanine--tRNA ligase subunit beta [Leptospira borgpetersenii serovar Tarassovi]MBE8414016.1 phenylalanine--tRNA ligase subunit beta [Leptospira borgpetersenii serovar Tarassovi]MBE8417342.1 phenylalanine--tRNA lig
MKLSLDWMNDFTPLKKVGLDVILKKIAVSVCEIDGVVPFRPELDFVKIVRIESLDKHPSADKLQIAEVFDGSSKSQIVTGATNVKVGDLVPLAIPGAKLGDREILESELRGVKSSGMFCSEKELSLSEESSGVWILNGIEGAEIGKTIRSFLYYEDVIFEIDNKSITHRPDLWSHFGFARELASQLRLPITFNPFESLWNFDLSVKLPRVLENQNAHSYYASSICEVFVIPSKRKFQSRLQKCGIRVINNVVDVSNYVMLEMGQPTHFFDKRFLESQGGVSLEVSYAKKGESFALLDETSPSLEEEILLIRNQGRPVAVAGVMGGKESAVQNNTTEIVMESAVFAREKIRKSIRSTGIRSDSSVRYEKGLEATTTLPVIRRALNLLKENGCPSLKASEPVGFLHTPHKEVRIHTDIHFINTKLGITLSQGDITDILERLHFMVSWKGDRLEALVPKFRHNYDVTIPEDLVEEIGRTRGYDTIQVTPLLAEIKTPIRNLSRELERKCKTFFSVGLGYHEVYNYSFQALKENELDGDVELSVKIRNEMPEEQSVLRNSLISSLLKNIRTNQDRFSEIKIFEFGRAYFNIPEPDNEKKFFSFAVSFDRKSSESDLGLLEDDFLKVRKEIESFLKYIRIFEYFWDIRPEIFFHPGASLSLIVDSKQIGNLGYVHPAVLDSFELKKRVIYGSLEFEKLVEIWNTNRNISRFNVPSQFPEAEIDISILIGEKENTNLFTDLVRREKIPELQEGWVYSQFAGGSVPVGKRSVSYRFRLVNYEKTFTQERIKEISDHLVALAGKNGFVLR